MRALWVAACLLAGCYRGTVTEAPPAPTPAPAAHREPDETDARTAARRFVSAVGRHDQAALRAMLDTTVDIRDLAFASDTCRRRFDLEQLVARTELDGFASCLGELDADLTAGIQPKVSRKDKRFAVELPTECVIYQLELVPRATQGLAISALMAESTCDEEGGVVGGVIGGVVGSASAPPPPPPPPPPSAQPQVVAPSMLEQLRVSGSAMIAPDDATKVKIAGSSKD